MKFVSFMFAFSINKILNGLIGLSGQFSSVFVKSNSFALIKVPLSTLCGDYTWPKFSAYSIWKSYLNVSDVWETANYSFPGITYISEKISRYCKRLKKVKYSLHTLYLVMHINNNAHKKENVGHKLKTTLHPLYFLCWTPSPYCRIDKVRI